MDQTTAEVDADAYVSALSDYLRTRREAALYQASLISRQFVQARVGPEEIVALHVDAMQQAAADLPPPAQASAAADGLHFLLEVMIAYGVQHQEYLDLRLRELAKSESDKSEILAVIAHELRLPITAARGSLDLAQRSLARGDIERLLPLLGRSRDAVERLTRLTRDLLDASRGAAPQLTMERQDLGALVEQAVAWASPSAAEKGVHLSHETSQAGAVVLGDADALLSIAGNLLSNAVRYTPAGGSVVVRHGADDREAWLEVSDTGIGMSPEVQARIWEKFYRSAEAQRLSTQGLGLGLTLVRQLVDTHRGRVELTSAPGQGSRFRICLPIAKEEA